MYLTLEDFIEDWKEESESTLRIFSVIPDHVKSIKRNKNVRSLERLAWHITQTVTEMPKSAGISEEDALENKGIPSNFSEIMDIYKEQCDRLAELIRKRWKDEDLTEDLMIYGQLWSGRKVLWALVKHQIHHRAQMTVLMRELDLKVPGIYGPAREEWSQYGMEPQE